MGACDENEERYGSKDYEEAEAKRNFSKMLKSNAMGVKSLKQVIPVLMILAQLGGVEGLSLGAAGVFLADYEDHAVSIIVTMAIGIAVMMVVFGIPWFAIFAARTVLNACTRRLPIGVTTRNVGMQTQGSPRARMAHRGVQADRADEEGIDRRAIRRFADEYTERVSFLETALQEEHRIVERCEDALKSERARFVPLRMSWSEPVLGRGSQPGSQSVQSAA